ncbi:MAG: FAD-dependent oxidoreductase [Ilumatobacteraceae bacterium]
MFVTASSLEEGRHLRHDVVVVGAGAAGITLAAELVAAGVDVGLVEGGGRTPTERSQARYQGPLTVGEGLEYPPLDAYRLRYFGGTTNHWGGWCRPLDASVMEPRPGVSDGWPFPRSELDQWYEIAHQWCEIGRMEYRISELGGPGQHLGRQLGRQLGDDLDVHVLRFSRPTRFGEAYGSIFDGPGSTVYLEANCTAIAMDGPAATHVVVQDEQGVSHEIAADRVVVACGGIETSRQLLLCAASGASMLDRSATLAAGFHEHPHVHAGTLFVDPDWLTTKAAEAVVGAAFDIDMTPYRATFALPADDSDGLLSGSVMLSLSGGADGVAVDGRHSTAVAALAELATSRSPAALDVFVRTEQRLEPSSRVVLGSEVDDTGVPRAGLDWRISPPDVDDIRRVRDRVLTRLMGVRALGAVGALEEPTGPTRLVTGGAHHMGGARIHESPDHGVVDADLRCHGTSNLHVCGSAVFPSSGWSNPTLTIVALAARLAHHLAGGTR